MTISLLASTAGCGDDVRVASAVEPVYEASCAFFSCSNQGSCTEGMQGLPFCKCNPGYAGDHCDLCAPGYHLDAEARCVRDRRCNDEPSNPCGQHGVCKDQTGVLVCACDRGYEGARCELCSAGYADEAGGPFECLLRGAGGSMAPPPAEDDGGCEPTTCGAYGECSESDAGVVCKCAPGYEGPRCDECQSGFGWRGDRCVPNSACIAGRCGACENFEDVTGAPAPGLTDQCVTRPSVELSDIMLHSSGEATKSGLSICAPSENYAFKTIHIALQTSLKEPAKLIFREPVRRLSLDFGARMFASGSPVTYELIADNRALETAAVSGGKSKSVNYDFEPAITMLSIRSLAPEASTVVIDNLSYDFANCR